MLFLAHLKYAAGHHPAVSLDAIVILSILLPDSPASVLSGGGVGTVILYAVATDMEGHSRLLDRNVNDQPPTTVTVANDTIAKPFGAIDTPGQGATVSGTLNNFGWALTPDPETTVLIPVNGSTIDVLNSGADAPSDAPVD